MYSEKKQLAITKAITLHKEANGANITCPECGKGMYGGYFYHSCTNKDCVLYNEFAMADCHICGRPRIGCAC